MLYEKLPLFTAEKNRLFMDYYKQNEQRRQDVSCIKRNLRLHLWRKFVSKTEAKRFLKSNGLKTAPRDGHTGS